MRLAWAAVTGRQVAAALAALLLSTVLIFGGLYLVPGDPLRFLTGGRQISAAASAVIRAQYHLDDPFALRYVRWLGDLLHGDLGRSLISGVPVAQLIAPRLGTTLLLLAMASVLMIAGGVAAGLVAGVGSRATDAALSLVTTVALAVPPFVAAALLAAVFAVGLGWFPVIGDGEGLGSRLHHLVLPAVALAIGGGAYIARVTRTAVRREQAREYVETAVARGLPWPRVVVRHVLRNAALPVTAVVGLTVAGLFAGTVVVESAFGLNGLGSLLVQSVLTKDFAVVQAVALLLVVAFVLVNLGVDLLALVLDPRLRAGMVR